MFDALNKARFEGGFFHLRDYLLYGVEGADAFSYFHNFSTNDVKNLKKYSFQMNTRLEINAKVAFYFVLAREEDELLLLIHKSYKNLLLAELEKFIIVEDVRPIERSEKIYVNLSPVALEGMSGQWFFEDAYLSFGSPLHQVELSREIVEQLEFFSGFRLLAPDTLRGSFVGETILNELAVDYHKGCFRGQETAAKMQNNRGAAVRPAITYEESKLKVTVATLGEYCLGLAKRAVLLEDEEVHKLPYFNDGDAAAKARHFFEEAMDLFNSNQEKQAIKKLEEAIVLDPSNIDYHEAIGVMWGRLGEYQKALDYMDQILNVDDRYVMAYTNKSLYAMKLGRIVEAEEFKAKATALSFEKLGEEAEAKKQREEEERRREKMYLEVLEVDALDSFASHKLAEIYLKRKEYPKAEPLLQAQIEHNQNNPETYHLLCRLFDETNRKEALVECACRGVDIAAKKGQEKLVKAMQKFLP